jgi:hypothetical protein
MAQTSSPAVAEVNFSVEDQNAIIKECLSFKILMDKIKNEAKFNSSDYNILDHGIEFKKPLDKVLNGEKISFITKAELKLKSSYFLFHTIDIKKDKAFVRYYFMYTTNGMQKRIPITIDFEKTKAKWQIVNHTI